MEIHLFIRMDVVWLSLLLLFIVVFGSFVGTFIIKTNPIGWIGRIFVFFFTMSILVTLSIIASKDINLAVGYSWLIALIVPTLDWLAERRRM